MNIEIFGLIIMLIGISIQIKGISLQVKEMETLITAKLCSDSNGDKFDE